MTLNTSCSFVVSRTLISVTLWISRPNTPQNAWLPRPSWVEKSPSASSWRSTSRVPRSSQRAIRRWVDRMFTGNEWVFILTDCLPEWLRNTKSNTDCTWLQQGAEHTVQASLGADRPRSIWRSYPYLDFVNGPILAHQLPVSDLYI